MKKFENIDWSVSYTTRPIRTGEEDGKDYFFISVDQFKDMIENDVFVEWFRVHSNYYGTSKDYIEKKLNSGQNVLLDLDVQGTKEIKNIFKDTACAIFIEPPSVEELENRLRKRATDKIEVIEERIQNAKKELLSKNDFDYLVMNDDIDKAYEQLAQIFKKELVK